MRLTPTFLSLPTSILLLIISHTTAHTSSISDLETQAPSQAESAAQWPYNLPPHVKFWPEDPPSRRRDLEAIEEHIRLGRKPVGVMKMSDDEGEKFYMEYWQFEGELEQEGLFETTRESSAMSRRGDFSGNEDEFKGNNSALLQFRPSFLLHTENTVGAEELKARNLLRRRNAAGVLAALQARDFTCPTGTKDCSTLMSPTSCCATDEVCFSIPDTGLGVIGCCPAGAQCSGVVTQCDAPNTPCPSILGGGCCIPGFSCVEGGCAMDPPSVVTTVITRTFTVIASSTTRTSTSISTAISTSSTACPLNVQACPASLGGGCCPTDRVCALSSCAPSSSSATAEESSTTTSTSIITTTTTSATGVIPVRPTSGTTTTSTSPSTDAGPTTCPTGFYACEAYYEGGCCRTGRNCEKTSCPPTSSTTIISSGVTVVVPVGSAASVATPTGACASGWETCAASVGGNCCPSGWGCGTASCSSVGPTKTAVLQKASPGGAVRLGSCRGWAVASVVFAMGLFGLV